MACARVNGKGETRGVRGGPCCGWSFGSGLVPGTGNGNFAAVTYAIEVCVGTLRDFASTCLCVIKSRRNLESY
jgi:hypothetical protein